MSQELEKPVSIIITESENCIMLNMRGHNLNPTYPNYTKVMARNEEYKQLLEVRKFPSVKVSHP